MTTEGTCISSVLDFAFFLLVHSSLSQMILLRHCILFHFLSYMFPAVAISLGYDLQRNS